MGINSAPRATLRQQFDGLSQSAPVDLKVFRELVRRASQGAWLAMARSQPIEFGLTTAFASSATRDPQGLWFGLYLVEPSKSCVEVLGKARGGPRTWTNLDSLSEFVESLLEATALKGRIRVHVV